MTILPNKTRTFWIVIFSVAGVATTIPASYLLYINYFQNYARLTVAQLDARLLPRTVEFVELPDEKLQVSPVLKGIFGQVSEKYQILASECPPNRPVYCDISSNTKVTTSVTAGEFESIMQSLNSGRRDYSDKVSSAWQSYVKRDCYYPIFHPGTTEADKHQECYYIITVER